jgi:hypothetical protein
MPGGTFNLLPKKRLQVKKPAKYLENIVRTSKEEIEDKFTKDAVHIMKVGDGNGNSHLTFSVGMGLPVELLNEAYKNKKHKYWKVAMVAARTVLSAAWGGSYYQKFNKKMPLKITYTNHQGEVREQEREWLAIMAQSVTTLGLPKRIDRLFWKAEKSPEMFHAVGTDRNLSTVLSYGIPILGGRNSSWEDWETGETIKVTPLNHQLKTLKIEADQEFQYQFNGELSYGSDPCVTRELHISNGPVIEFIDNFFR